MNALLLCAGFGTRLQPYTDVLPKPAIPLLNVPIAYYSLHLVQQLGIKRVVVNTHHLPEQVKELFSEDKSLGVPVVFSDEQPAILDTGGALRAARSYLEGSGPFVVANTDAVRAYGLREILENHRKQNALATMVVTEHPELGTKYGAVWVKDNGEIVDFAKTKPQGVDCKPFHYTGLQIVEEAVFKYIPEGPSSITKDVYKKALLAGEKLFACRKQGLWIDTGSLEDYLDGTRKMLGILPRLQHEPQFQSLFRRFWPLFDRRPSFWEGSGCQHHLELGSDRPVLLGNGCEIADDIQIQGFCVLGDNVRIGHDVQIQSSVVLSNTEVKAGSVLKNTLLLPDLPSEKSV